jgi:hypothetical protein
MQPGIFLDRLPHLDRAAAFADPAERDWLQEEAILVSLANLRQALDQGGEGVAA